MRALTERRQREWLATIRWRDLNPDVYHYISVLKTFFDSKLSQLFDSTHPDWIPSIKEP